LWYNFLKTNNAYCIDPNVNYQFLGDTGTNDLKVMVLDIDRCQNKAGQPPHCADDIAMDIWLAKHQFNLYALSNKIDLEKMKGRPVTN